jgi:hypothetical protein
MRVKRRYSNTGINRATTDAQGEYAVTDLPIGVYEVHAQQGQFMETVPKGSNCTSPPPPA